MRTENKERRNEFRRIRMRTDIKFNLNYRIRKMIRKSLKNGYGKQGRHWKSLVPYTLIQLEKHLESTLPKSYTWEDFMQGKLHIDHKIPISIFNFTEPEHIDFQRCWALSNLQLLPAKENIRKSNKITEPFQPSLALKTGGEDEI